MGADHGVHSAELLANHRKIELGGQRSLKRSPPAFVAWSRPALVGAKVSSTALTPHMPGRKGQEHIQLAAVFARDRKHVRRLLSLLMGVDGERSVAISARRM